MHTSDHKTANTLILMRGPPCSGKSTIAQSIGADLQSTVIYSTDEFFMIDGKYCFDIQSLSAYHQKNIERTRRAMEQNIQTIIIDNTNIKISDMCPYINLANKFQYLIDIRPMPLVKTKELLRRNALRKHRQLKSVPSKTIHRMAREYDPSLKPSEILGACSRIQDDQ